MFSLGDRALSFLNEITEGTMLHARSTLPHETTGWKTACTKESKDKCRVGFACSDSTTYTDKLVDTNMFVDDQGGYCNCWRNHHIEGWVPKLEEALQELL